MNQYRLMDYTCPYCNEKSDDNVCRHSDCQELHELNKCFREAKTAQLQIPLALGANKLRNSIKRRKEKMMAERKWFPVGKEQVVKTENYRYVFGWYNHEEYGDMCFRISKYIRSNGFFVGHFVVVPEDQDAVFPVIAEHIAETYYQ